MGQVIVPDAVYTGVLARNRQHVTRPQDWGNVPGTDFWAFFSAAGGLTAGNAHELSDYGFTTTALSYGAGAGADFITSADVGTPARLLFDAASDKFQSPALFGDYAHAYQAQQFLGYLPTALNMEAYASFAVATGNETASGFGFVEDGGDILTAGDAMATITSNGTNFVCRSGADSDAGAAVDTSAHLWKITVGAGPTNGIEWFIDGTSQGTLDTQTDEWPAAFGGGVQAAGGNFFVLHWLHIWYS